MLIFLSMSSAWATLPQPGQDMRSVCALIGTEVDALLGTFTVINTDFNATFTAIAALSTLITRDFNFTMTAIAGVSSLVTTDFNNTFTTIAALGACVPIVLSQASVSNGGILLTTSGASYCLSQNITGSIIISASDVTVDLNTHSLLGTIDIISTVINATIKNGKIKPAAPTNTTDAAHAAIVIASTVDKALIKNCYVVCSDSTLIGIVGRDGIANGGTNTIINSCFIQAGAGGLSSNGGNGVTVTNSTSEILNCTITAGAGGGATVFVADEGGITITSFPIPANTPVAAITVGNNPNAIAITPDRTKAYVVNYNGGSGPAGADTVSVINIATGAVTKTIGGFSGPFAIAITPDGTKAYVVNNIANGGLFTVSVINTATDTIIGSPITVGSSPTSIAITPDGTKAYVTNSAPDNTVSVITIATNTVTTTIPTSGKFNNPWAIAITPNGQFAYVVNSGGGTVTPITIAGNALGANITVGNLPKGIAITPDGTMAYVTNDTDHTVTPITLSTNTPLTSLSGSFSNPYGIAITSDGKTAYVTNS
ncbi:MAG: hypothetical protein P4M14_10215, partial [Gammaproteobacteria bacterium]|nr:hypothetical protein [Gammaproteobacteria bacterium]